MKNIISFISLIIFIVSILQFQACTSDLCNETITYNKFDPVYLSETELRDINIEPAKNISEPGKIYVYGKYLLVNEKYKGIHILDNSDLNNPLPLSFISIPGNTDMAIRNGILYADSFIDLLSFNIQDPSQPILIQHQKNIFSVNKNNKNGILVYYKPTKIVEHIDCNDTYFGEDEFFRGDVLYSQANEDTGGKNYSAGTSVNSNGQGGSMARFTLVDDRLYVVDKRKLNVFDVSNESTPIRTNTINVGWGIETIFPYKDHLFIGSQRGMYIFNNTDKDNPTLMSTFSHATVCDPVYVKGNVAYVTLRNGNKCGGYTNQLDVLDITDLSSPILIKSYPMSNPHGLTIVKDRMILCEGQFGLKVLNIKNSNDIETKSKIKDIHFYDAIGISADHIILTGNDGIFQYKLNHNKLVKLGAIYSQK